MLSTVSSNVDCETVQLTAVIPDWRTETRMSGLIGGVMSRGLQRESMTMAFLYSVAMLAGAAGLPDAVFDELPIVSASSRGVARAAADIFSKARLKSRRSIIVISRIGLRRCRKTHFLLLPRSG